MTSEGDAMLFLMPHEEQYVQVLHKHGLWPPCRPVASYIAVISQSCVAAVMCNERGL